MALMRWRVLWRAGDCFLGSPGVPGRAVTGVPVNENPGFWE